MKSFPNYRTNTVSLQAPTTGNGIEIVLRTHSNFLRTIFYFTESILFFLLHHKFKEIPTDFSRAYPLFFSFLKQLPIMSKGKVLNRRVEQIQEEERTRWAREACHPRKLAEYGVRIPTIHPPPPAGPSPLTKSSNEASRQEVRPAKK